MKRKHIKDWRQVDQIDAWLLGQQPSCWQISPRRRLGEYNL